MDLSCLILSLLLVLSIAVASGLFKALTFMERQYRRQSTLTHFCIDFVNGWSEGLGDAKKRSAAVEEFRQRLAKFL